MKPTNAGSRPGLRRPDAIARQLGMKHGVSGRSGIRRLRLVQSGDSIRQESTMLTARQFCLPAQAGLYSMAKSTDTKALGTSLGVMSIFEALLLALIDQKIMTAKQVRDVLDDAAIAHRDSAKNADDVAARREALAVVERLAASVKKAALPD